MQYKIYDIEKGDQNINSFLKDGKVMALGDFKTLTVVSKGNGSVALVEVGKKMPIGAWTVVFIFKNNTEILEWFKKNAAIGIVFGTNCLPTKKMI